ncbi:MAG TPA: plastocyanin/azurin family copper-binding protein [Solirubrobacterales bacterium]|jgi:plastocyanin|nr:plastocyanin/azurin family copper-binding protein [Solirubrobacterales bacterium]
MKKYAALIAMLLAAVALVACGGSDNTTSEATAPPSKSTTETEETNEGNEAEGGTAGSASTVDIEADPEGGLSFTSDSASAKAGKVTVDFTNSSPVPHNVTIEDEGGETVAATETLTEGSEAAKANLKPGTYTFYCSVPGHRDAGMEGTLTVK